MIYIWSLEVHHSAWHSSRRASLPLWSEKLWRKTCGILWESTGCNRIFHSRYIPDMEKGTSSYIPCEIGKGCIPYFLGDSQMFDTKCLGSKTRMLPALHLQTIHVCHGQVAWYMWYRIHLIINPWDGHINPYRMMTIPQHEQFTHVLTMAHMASVHQGTQIPPECWSTTMPILFPSRHIHTCTLTYMGISYVWG